MINLTDRVKHKATHSKEKSDEHGEVFTPPGLINQMLDSLPKDFWYNKNKMWFDPCAGKGNMPAVVVERLMKTLSTKIEDVDSRYKHIMENMIYMCEYQKESCETIEEIFNPNDNLKLNLYFGDTLKIPEDFFDLPWEQRRTKYPDNCVEPIGGYKINKIDPWMINILKLASKIPKEIKKQDNSTDLNRWLNMAKEINKKIK